VSSRRRRSVFARAATLGALLPLLVGCTGEDPVVHDERMRWAETALPSWRADVLDAFDSGALTAENAFAGSLRFESVPAGEYDVYLACRGGWQIAVEITGDRGEPLGTANLLCDTATAVEVTTRSKGLIVRATAPPEDTDWAVLVLPTAKDENVDENAMHEEAA
jgi:hypothetical protein